MPSYTNTILITGGTSGVGLCCAEEVAVEHKDTLIVVASRSEPTKPFKSSNIKYLPLNLVSPDSIASLAKALSSQPPISAYIANAGYSSGGPPKINARGIETDFAANYVGHADLFFRLKELKIFASDCRFVFVSSGGHDPQEKFNPAPPAYRNASATAEATGPELQNCNTRYSTSKVAVVLFAYSLANQIKSGTHGNHWTSVAYDPAFAPGRGSKLTRNQPAPVRFMVTYIVPYVIAPVLKVLGMAVSTPRESGKALAALAANDEYASVTGKYYQVWKEKPSSKQTYEETLQTDLWEWTMRHLTQNKEQRASYEMF